jgi:hypothetical protein
MRVVRWGWAVGLGALLAACGAHAPREAVVREGGVQWVYERPLGDVWPAARALLEERGYVVRPAGAGPLLQTDWKDEGDGRHSRYRVEGEALGPGSCVVRFERHTRGAAAQAQGTGGSGPLNRGGEAPR